MNEIQDEFRKDPDVINYCEDIRRLTRTRAASKSQGGGTKGQRSGSSDG